MNGSRLSRMEIGIVGPIPDRKVIAERLERAISTELDAIKAEGHRPMVTVETEHDAHVLEFNQLAEHFRNVSQQHRGACDR